MDASWVAKSSLYELLAKTFQQTTREFSEFVRSGEYACALEELARACGLSDEVASQAACAMRDARYETVSEEDLFHALRQAYTRLFIGGMTPLVSPFAGIWWADRQGIGHLLMVNAESLAVERFMRTCGIAHRAEGNEPVDFIGSELEFMQYLSAVIASGTAPEGLASLTPERARDIYREFYNDHFQWFSHDLAEAVVRESQNGVYRAAGLVLAALPKKAA